MANTSGQKELRRNWPVEEGLTARTQKQEGRQSNLIPEESSLVSKREKVGL